MPRFLATASKPPRPSSTASRTWCEVSDVTAYYNELDPYAAQWLRNLIAAGHIAPGEVDERSILDVCPDDLTGFTQCHFFAGIGVWSHSLRKGGWPDSRPVWTGSCPCQPFSLAGVGSGFDDERHLWPFWFHLIEQCRPAVVFGEQVEAAIKHGWLDLVQADMEGIGYAFAAAGVPAAGVGAPHIRSRLFFVADSDDLRLEQGPGAGLRADAQHDAESFGDPSRLAHAERIGRPAWGAGAGQGQVVGLRGDSELADPNDDGLQGRVRGWQDSQRQALDGSAGYYGAACESGRLDDPLRIGRKTGRSNDAEHDRLVASSDGGDDRAGAAENHWRDADWLFCRDGKWRPVEPGTFPLAHGAAARVGRLRAYGNAIVAQVAAEVVSAYMECRP